MKRLSFAIALGVLALVLVAAPTQAAGGAPDRVCGERPGQGAFNVYKVWNTTCKRARKIDRRAVDKFCRGDVCDVSPGDFVEGQVRVRGWSCNILIGYESLRDRCRDGNRRFVHKAGS